jgi:hypothetical protein
MTQRSVTEVMPLTTRPATGRIALAILLAGTVACGSGDTLRITAIQLGRSVNADGTVANHTTSFAPGDTVYVSVQTAGVGSGTIGVRWMYSGRVIGEPKKDVAYRDVAATEFHLQSSTGFPPGDYTAEVFLDGQSFGVKEFRVERQD